MSLRYGRMGLWSVWVGGWGRGRGTGPDDDALMRSLRGQSRAEGVAEGKVEGEKRGRTKGLAEGRRKGLAEGERKGRAEGEKKGRAKGLAEGRRKGRADTLARVARRMLRSRGVEVSEGFLADPVFRRIVRGRGVRGGDGLCGRGAVPCHAPVTDRARSGNAPGFVEQSGAVCNACMDDAQTLTTIPSGPGCSPADEPSAAAVALSPELVIIRPRAPLMRLMIEVLNRPGNPGDYTR